MGAEELFWDDEFVQAETLDDCHMRFRRRAAFRSCATLLLSALAPGSGALRYCHHGRSTNNSFHIERFHTSKDGDAPIQLARRWLDWQRSKQFSVLYHGNE